MQQSHQQSCFTQVLRKHASSEPSFFPEPPVFSHSSMCVPSFFRYHHAFNKSMINMIRNGGNGRLSTMIRDRPELFQQFYQIPDLPEEVTGDSHDIQRLFHPRAVLYLNPLCLAIYMKKDVAANVILASGLNKADDCSYGTYVFQKNDPGDVLQLYPMCILVKREHFGMLPLLLEECGGGGGRRPQENGNSLLEAAMTPLNLHYVTTVHKKILKFQDVFQYGLETFKRNNNFNIGRFLDSLLSGVMQSTQSGGRPEFISKEAKKFLQILFHRLLQTIHRGDQEGVITSKLLKCLETILRWRCFSATPSELFSMDASGDYQVVTVDPQNCHNECALTLLFCLYHTALQRQKLAFLDKLGILIYRMLSQCDWLTQLNHIPPLILRQICMDLPEDSVFFTVKTLQLVSRHMQFLAQKEYSATSEASSMPSNVKSSGVDQQSHRHSPFNSSVFLPDFRRQQALRRLLIVDTAGGTTQGVDCSGDTASQQNADVEEIMEQRRDEEEEEEETTEKEKETEEEEEEASVNGNVGESIVMSPSRCSQSPFSLRYNGRPFSSTTFTREPHGSLCEYLTDGISPSHSDERCSRNSSSGIPVIISPQHRQQSVSSSRPFPYSQDNNSKRTLSTPTKSSLPVDLLVHNPTQTSKTLSPHKRDVGVAHQVECELPEKNQQEIHNKEEKQGMMIPCANTFHSLSCSFSLTDLSPGPGSFDDKTRVLSPFDFSDSDNNEAVDEMNMEENGEKSMSTKQDQVPCVQCGDMSEMSSSMCSCMRTRLLSTSSFVSNRSNRSNRSDSSSSSTSFTFSFSQFSSL